MSELRAFDQNRMRARKVFVEALKINCMGEKMSPAEFDPF